MSSPPTRTPNRKGDFVIVPCDRPLPARSSLYHLRLRSGYVYRLMRVWNSNAEGMVSSVISLPRLPQGRQARRAPRRLPRHSHLGQRPWPAGEDDGVSPRSLVGQGQR